MRQKLNAKYTQISLYVIATVLIIYVLIQIAGHFGDILGAAGTGIVWLGVVIKPLAYGFGLAYLLYPLVEFNEKHADRLKKRAAENKKESRFTRRRNSAGKLEKSSRGLAVAITCIIVLAGIFALLSIIVSAVSKELRVVSFSDLGDLVNSITLTIDNFYQSAMSALSTINVSSDDLTAYLQNIGEYAVSIFKQWGNNLLTSTSNVVSFFSTLLFAIIFAIYFMLDGKGLMQYWNRAFESLVPRKVSEHFHSFIKEADTVFSGYIRGQLMDALFMAVAVSISLSLIGVKYAVIIGVLTGIGNLIPYVGPFVAYISTILVCLLNWNPQRLLIAIVILFFVQLIDANVVNPKFLSKNVDIHPLLVIVSLIIGSAVGGLMGMLLAVPCGALIKIYFEKLTDYLRKRKSLKNGGQDESAGNEPAQDEAEDE